MSSGSGKKGLWVDERVTGLYTLGPLHIGVGQAAGAVDLPIAREAGTGFPMIPASGLKGAARAFLRGRLDKEALKQLFGPDLGNDSEENLAVGLLTFTEANLIAYPVRSLNQPFFYATCPRILDRWQRDLRALAVNGEWGTWAAAPMPDNLAEHLAVTNAKWTNEQALVLEDLAFEKKEIAHFSWLEETAERLSSLLPPGEDYTRRQFIQNLVCLPDEDFADLMRRIVPVRARTQLTDGKTTDKWIDPAGNTQTGNLWYEEYVPGDTLFGALVGQRRVGDGSQGNSGDSHADLSTISAQADALALIQIGGNETVGYGLCSWAGWRQGGQQHG